MNANQIDSPKMLRIRLPNQFAWLLVGWLAGCWSAEGLSFVCFFICFITYWVFQLLINNPNTYIFYVMVIFVIFLVVPRVRFISYWVFRRPAKYPKINAKIEKQIL